MFNDVKMKLHKDASVNLKNGKWEILVSIGGNKKNFIVTQTMMEMEEFHYGWLVKMLRTFANTSQDPYYFGFAV